MTKPLTAKELKLLGMLPDVLRVLEKLNALQSQLRGFMGQAPTVTIAEPASVEAPPSPQPIRRGPDPKWASALRSPDIQAEKDAFLEQFHGEEATR